MAKLRLAASIAVALLAWLPYRLVRRRRLLLVGGHEGRLYADNGRALYEYLSAHHGDFETRWVIDRDSPDWARVEAGPSSGSGPIARGSVRAYLDYLVADGVFFSHTASDLAPVLHKLVRGRAVKVFIEHGIVGLKRAKTVGLGEDRLGPAADLWVCASAFEKDIKVREWGLPAEQVRITGLARYDTLRRPPQLRREIIYMPTQREWLSALPPQEFVRSEFFRGLTALLTNRAMSEVLQANDYDLKIYLHFYFHRFLASVGTLGARMELLAADTDVQDQLINASVLITDYSSVAWDFFYLDKPTLFYQPDLVTFTERRGSYLDPSTEFFGPQSVNANELAAQLAQVLTREPLTAGDEFARSRYFAFFDTANCERVFREFEGELTQRRQKGLPRH